MKTINQMGATQTDAKWIHERLLQKKGNQLFYREYTVYSCVLIQT